ncbi:MAG: beta-ketoacyl-ACP synthase [Proteobacteria bacterium]|nr:beta-ketoacyl-ACP synthase [Pseudomonadota bacterium]
MGQRDVVITGVGLVSSLGEGLEAHAGALKDPSAVNVDATTYAPFSVHPAVALELDRQIPKKLDQKQMEPWQRLGTYAAGLALEMAGLKGDKEKLSETQLIVAAGGGERDYAVDGQILTEMPKSATPGVLLNEKLMGELRPTLFLAQLSNLLAGNISIVHGVTGASRTFMGEEQCGVDAVRIAFERIRAGQGDRFLVGSSYNSERPDSLLIFAMGGVLKQGGFAPVQKREASPGMILGSAGAFFVMEAREAAEARGATILAELADVSATRSIRDAGAVAASLGVAIDAVKPALSGAVAVISGASGCADITAEEFDVIAEKLPGAPIRATGNRLGHALESQFAVSLALGVLTLKDGALFPPAAGSGEAPADTAPQSVLVTSVGHKRGEGAAALKRTQ